MDLDLIKDSTFQRFGDKIDPSIYADFVEHIIQNLLPTINNQLQQQQQLTGSIDASGGSIAKQRKRPTVGGSSSSSSPRKRVKITSNPKSRASTGSANKKCTSFYMTSIDFISIAHRIMQECSYSKETEAVVFQRELIAYFEDHFGQAFTEYYAYRKTMPNFIIQDGDSPDDGNAVYGYNMMETRCAMTMNENCRIFSLRNEEATDQQQQMIYLIIVREIIKLCNNFALTFKFSVEHFKFFLATWYFYVNDSLFSSMEESSTEGSTAVATNTPNATINDQFIMLGGCNVVAAPSSSDQQQQQTIINISKSNSVASKKAAVIKNQKTATLKKRQQHCMDGAIFQDYVKSIDDFYWKINSVDRSDFNAILFIVKNRISLPRSIYNRTLTSVRPVSMTMREKDFENESEYVVIPCKTFYRGLRVLVTSFYIFVQQDLTFQPPSNGLEQDPQFFMLMQKLLTYGQDCFLYLDVFYGECDKHVVLDILKSDLGNASFNLTTTTNYSERMALVRENFPFLTLAQTVMTVTATAAKPAVEVSSEMEVAATVKYNDYGFIHMPVTRCNGKPAYYFYNKINLIGAIVGKFELNYVAVAFRADNDDPEIATHTDNSILLKSILRINLIGQSVVSILSNEFAAEETIVSDDNYVFIEDATNSSNRYKVLHDSNVRYFKRLVPIEIRNIDKFGNVVYGEEISKVSDYMHVKRTLDYEAQELEKKVQNRQKKLQQQQQQHQQKSSIETHKEMAQKLEKEEDMQNVLANMSEEAKQALLNLLKK